MDDITFGSQEPLITSDIKHSNTNDGTIGLDLNFIKCEQIKKLSAIISEPIGLFLHYAINNTTT